MKITVTCLKKQHDIGLAFKWMWKVLQYFHTYAMTNLKTHLEGEY